MVLRLYLSHSCRFELVGSHISVGRDAHAIAVIWIHFPYNLHLHRLVCAHRRLEDDGEASGGAQGVEESKRLM
jgi:hypothetical protein